MNDPNEKAKVKGGKRRVVLGVLIAVAILVVLVFGSLALSVGPQVILVAKKAKLKNEMVQVQTAVLSYYTEYSVYPAAPDAATLVRILTGATKDGNERQIAFATFKPSDLDAKGDLLDPWGTPIELSVTADGKLHARSAGPDKIFGTRDDVTVEDNLYLSN